MSSPERRSSLPVTMLCGLNGPRVSDVEAGLLLRGERLAAVHLDLRGVEDGVVECRVTDSDGRSTAQIFDLAHDCVSCTLRESTALVVRRLIATGRYDSVIVRLHPGVEVAPAVAALDAELGSDAHIDTVLLDLDATWLDQLGSDIDVTQAGVGIVAGDDRGLAGVLASGLDVASVIMVAGPARRQLAADTSAALGALAPDARLIHPSTAIDVFGDDVIRTESYRAATHDPLHRGGLLSPRSQRLSDRPGLTTARWEASTPLHPQRLHAALDRLSDGVLRSSGRLWFASQPDVVIGWDSAGERLALGPQARWPDPLRAGAARPRPPFGGRRNVLAFLGRNLDEDFLAATLDGCLLTPDEVASGPACWRQLPDPFPQWDAHDDQGAA